MRLLARDPKDRYQNAAELIDDLERVQRGETPAFLATTQQESARPAITPARPSGGLDSPPPYPGNAKNGPQRRRVLPWVLAAGLLAGLVAAVALIIGSNMKVTPSTIATTDSASTDSSIIFKDDFSSTSNAWPQRTYDDGGISDYANGAYRIYNPPPPSTRTELVSTAGTIKDASVEVDASRTGDAPSSNSGWGVVCRAPDYKNYYFMGIREDGRTYISKMKDNTAGELTSAASSNDIKGLTTNHIRGDCIGSKLTLYINDQKLLEAEDADFDSGQVGLQVTNGSGKPPGTDVLFDDFSVSKP
jgi:hypothetical protein